MERSTTVLNLELSMTMKSSRNPASFSLIFLCSSTIAACGDESSSDETSVRDTSERDTNGRDSGASDEDVASADASDAPQDTADLGTEDLGIDDVAVSDSIGADDDTGSATEPGDLAQGPCGGADGECPSGLDCVNTGQDGAGFCQLPCDGGNCDDVRGENAICALGIAGEPEPTYCVPLCSSNADCAAGHTCSPVTESLSVCAP